MQKRVFFLVIAILIMAFAFSGIVSAAEAESVLLSSPNGKITVEIAVDDAGQLHYSVSKNGVCAVKESSIGITTSVGTFTSGLVLNSVERCTINETITMQSGSYPSIKNHANELVLCFANNYTVIFRAYDDGVAFRQTVPTLLDMMFDGEFLIAPDSNMKDIYDIFGKLYEQYLGRELFEAEKAVLSSAIKIMIWKVYGRTFHNICQFRYSYASCVSKRRKLYDQGKIDEANELKAQYLVGYHSIPDKNLKPYPLVSPKIAAKDVDYDLIVYDTYDFLDKLIGFDLSDIFYAIFHQYYEETREEKALKLAKYFKYGTDKEQEIWLLRYGFNFEEIDWVAPCVERVGEDEIVFNDKIADLTEEQLDIIKPFQF